MFPYADNPLDYWTGYYVSRQSAKKQVRDGQANLHASNFIYALKAIDKISNDYDIQQIMESKESMLDSMGVY